jgi:signal transduction histidine kinase
MTTGDEVCIADLVHRIAEERTATLEEPGRLVIGSDAVSSVVRVDEGHVYRIISNLIDNALKYSTASVTVSISEDDTGVVVSVRDLGPGIPADQQDRIFERFYQVDQSLTRLVGGAGMGLYICRKAAEGLGGRVWLERSDATGSVFSLWLPRVPQQRASEAELLIVGA